MYDIHFQIGMHESSLYSPFEVMFGRKPVLPIDLNDKQPRPDLDVSVDMQEAIDTFTTERLHVFKEVKENVKKGQIKQKEQYDRKHATLVTFEVCYGFIV